MKRIVNRKSIGLVLVILLVAILSINTKKVKATGTITWNGASSITINENINNIINPIAGSRTYCLEDASGLASTCSATATITYTGNETISSQQISKTTTMNLSSLTFDEPGDYSFWLYDQITETWLDKYYHITRANTYYNVVVSVRNEVDANNEVTGNYTANLILNKCEYDTSTGNYVCSKVTPIGGVLYVDVDYYPDSNAFGHTEITKTVKGTGAKTTEYFPFNITLQIDSNVCSPLNCNRWSFPITGIDSTATYNGSTVNNPTSITPGTQVTVYLKDGQTVVIGEGEEATRNAIGTFDTIPAICDSGGISFEKNNPNKIIESKRLSNLKSGRILRLGEISYYNHWSVSETAGDYSTTIFDNSGYTQTGTSFTNAEFNCGTTQISFVNTKEMSPLTGIIIKVAPYVILIAVGIGGFFIFRYLRRKKKLSN